MILFKRTFILFVIQLAGLTFCVNAQIANHETGYIQTDRTVYVAGESVFYKLYVLDATSKKRSDLSKVGYILLRNANPNPTLKIRIKIDSGLAAGSFVLPDTLTSGVYQLIAFTSEMKNFGERQFIHKEIVIANRFDKELNFKLINSGSTDNSKIHPADVKPEIKTDKLTYGSREKVIVSLGKTNSKANVSVSVFEDPGIASTDKSIAETLAGLSTVQPDKKVLNTYLPESKEKIIRGRVIDETTQKTIKDATVLLSCMDSIPNLQYAVTNSNGMFQMLLSDYYNGKELFFTIKDMPANQHWKIVTEDEFALSNTWNPPLTEIKDNFKKFIDKSQNIVYINKCYQLNNVLIAKPVADRNYICPQLYHCPVSTVLLSDFVQLNDLPEIAVELLPQLRIYNDNGKYSARIMFESSNLYYDKPAVFLDGVFVDDLNKIIGLGSEQIKKIDIVQSERAFGNLIFEGIISITSKSNEILNTTPASYSLRIKNDNFNQGGSFVDVNPDSIKDKNIPYYKQLLYWNPNLELSGTDSTKFEFYTSDNTANFIIKVEGISDDGTPISASSTIQVNNKLNVTVK
ncbi:MAG: hypothetical protein P4L34_01310 [Paludibacter sp.]|nr:hypothetical protein [Paludibacter sp.]